MKNVEFYENVPAGSTLEVSLGPVGDLFTGSALFITSGDVKDQLWGDTEIRPGPKKQPLKKGNGNDGLAYMLEMRVAFLKAATAQLDIRIRKPDGTLYSTPKIWEIKGKKGADELRILFIRMAA